MNKDTKPYISAFISGAIVAGIVFLIGIGPTIAGIAGLVVGVIVAVVMIARSRGEKPEDVLQEVAQQATKPDPHAKRKLVCEQLVRLNEKLRFNSPDQAVLTAVEATIDQMVEVIPDAIESAPGTQAAFDLEKTSTDYFPELITGYLDLSPEDQQSKQSDILAQIKEVSDTVTAAKVSFDAGKLDEFEISSSFLKAKLS